MGHRRLDQLPVTRKLQKVIELLAITEDPATIARATCEAVNRGLEIAKKDLGVTATAYYLMKFIWAAPKDHFGAEMQKISIGLSPNAGLLDVVVAFDEGVNQRLRRMGHRTDLAEMVRLKIVLKKLINESFTDH